MNQLRLDDYLDHIERAARRAVEFIGDQSRAEFLVDIKTQQAVAMSFGIMGEAATRIVALYPEFVAGAADIGWREMRGMRHHLVHGYFRNELPRLLQRIGELRA